MKYTDLTNKLINNLQVKHPATMVELQRYVPQVTKWTEFDETGYKWIVRTTNNRNKYWWCVCIECGTYHVVRSDKIQGKICRCIKKKT